VIFFFYIFIFISTTHIIKFSIFYFLSFFLLFFRVILCFINRDYRLIRMDSPN
jgi:hypothetical protein